MTTVKVDGVLISNENTRNEQLKRIYWSDKQYTDFSNGDFVHKADIKDREVTPITSGKTLIDYTYNSDTDFSRGILRHYYANGVRHPIYENNPKKDNDRWRWEGDYIDTFSPNISPIYKVAQVKLSEGELRAQIANEKRFLNEKYITPALNNFYGNKINAQIGIMQYTIKERMDGILHAGTGRMADISEAKVIDDYKSYDEKKSETPYSGDSLVTTYLRANIDESKKRYPKSKTPDDVYVGFTADKKLDGKRFLIDDSKISQSLYNNDNGEKVYRTFNEGDLKHSGSGGEAITSDSSGTEKFFTPLNKEKSIVTKTNDLFNEHKIETLIGRFHTSIKENENGLSSVKEQTDTAKSKYGNSHGRNLLKKDAERVSAGEYTKTNDYENPYCRVWTYHHQYDNLTKTIRPFSSNPEEDNRAISKNKPYKTVYLEQGSVSNGDEYLRQNTVMGKNGLVNITPKNDSKVEIKKCMFSIENLAWKDVPRKGGVGGEGYYLSDEQRGPNGGRIMWFPPYDLDFQENVQVEWNSSRFIGRGEPVYTYSNTNRSGTLSFCILVDHPSVIDSIPKFSKNENLLSETDILRFFAGCDIPDFYGDKPDSKDEDVPVNTKPDGDNPINVPDLSKGRRIKFYVYFPNNYSGNGVVTEKNDWEINGSSDRLWYDYLFFGSGKDIPNGKDPSYVGSGYEMSSNSGITPEGYDDGDIVKIKNKNWTEGEGVVNGVKYQYRTDFDLRQKLFNITKGKKWRGMEYKTSNYVDSRGFSLNIDGDSDKSGDSGLYSFGDIVYSMFKADSSKFNGDELLDERISTITHKNDSQLNMLIELFKDPKRINLVDIRGGATVQDRKNSNILAKRRCRSLKDLLKNFINENKIFADVEDVGALQDESTINSKESKVNRYACAEIYFDCPEIDANSASFTSAVEEIKNRVSRNILVSITKPERYENEAEYFKTLKNSDPFVFKSLTEKFKYFTPAFHSISPEGFNARINFLQQCTRQGHTIEASSNNGFAKTAGNLSFGRMPVCVLRLGDFLNTRIIVNGINISYGANGPMQWDLNQEGIGVQPMYAKVSMSITILGGQSLEGPINRLQNAVTFNYYANTGVYDNRSDRIKTNNADTVPSSGNGEVVRTNRETGRVTTDDSWRSNSVTEYTHVFTPIPLIDEKDIKK